MKSGYTRNLPDRFIGSRRRRPGLLFAAILLLVLLAGSSYIAGTLIAYNWWSEIHQIDTWWKLLLYGTVPVILAVVVFFAVFWSAFVLGMRSSKETSYFGFITRSLVMKLGALALAFLSFIVANATVDSWTVVRFFGGRRQLATASEYADPIFGRPLHFYLFDLPFLNMLVSVLLTASIISLLIYWLAAHAERISKQLPSRFPAEMTFQMAPFSFREAFASGFARSAAVLLLAGIAAKLFFSRYALLTEDHGQYLVGVDWTADHVVLPLQWLLILGCAMGALLVAAKKPSWALFLLLLLPIRWFLPPLVASLYVRPTELALERPYIKYHIDATRSAYGLTSRVKETVLNTASEVPIDYAKHKALLDNVRLWDWRAFHDTISQIQPLRPYVYDETDPDRYVLDGQLRQVLMAPRELQISQIGEAASRWINPHLIYTHGYGVVMAEANRITADGLPVLFIKDAPPVITTKSLKLLFPEIYFSEVEHEPVFVDTGQPEFNYPSGSENVQTTYKGQGGFLISNPLMRLAAAVHYGDANILLTEYLTSKSRMMIHRSVLERLNSIAGFLTWDSDPYLVVTDAGRLVWIVDGYMSSDAHPYSRDVSLGDQSLNYMRNSVKATVDAYNGETNLYIFDPNDVLIQAYGRLFQGLFKPSSAMPADLRAHARYPETLFRVQAEIYRTFHMLDPEAFYNRADSWDFAKTASQQDGGTANVSPTYVVASLPGNSNAEFLLLTTFTPANKDNLIGVMYARCDGEHLGELIFGQLAKQNIIYGPMQIAARVNQDQTISKDLSLWDQRGSSVLRGQTLVLPIDNSFLYVEPIYIQSSQTSMPQLKKVALAMGNKLAYANTYEEALAELIEDVGGKGGGSLAPVPQQEGPASAKEGAAAAAAPAGQAADILAQVRDHLQRYRELNSQGKWAEAGKELEEIQKLVQK
jgi:uncharacterized membrane protein (UPF0182 family)